MRFRRLFKRSKSKTSSADNTGSIKISEVPRKNTIYLTPSPEPEFTNTPRCLSEMKRLAESNKTHNLFKKYSIQDISRRYTSVNNTRGRHEREISLEQNNPLKSTDAVFIQPFSDEPPLQARFYKELVNIEIGGPKSVDYSRG